MNKVDIELTFVCSQFDALEVNEFFDRQQNWSLREKFVLVGDLKIIPVNFNA